jgi:hypothetical protein
MRPGLPMGLAFEVGDLILAKSWASFHDARMTIRLDHGSEHEEYEEILEFRWGRKADVRFILWRGLCAVFIQPLPGRRRAFGSLAAALDSVHVETPVRLTDIIAATWPRDGELADGGSALRRSQ